MRFKLARAGIAQRFVHARRTDHALGIGVVLTDLLQQPCIVFRSRTGFA